MLIYLAYSNKPLRLPDRDRKLPTMNGLGKKKMKLSKTSRIEITNYCIIMVSDDTDDG